MKSESDPQQGADLLMHIKVRPEEAEGGLNQDIILLHTESCTLCGGRGKLREERCHNCHGSGHIRVKRKIEVHIPSGVKNGMRLRLKGLGEAGDYGTENGDLFIEVNIRSDDQSIIKCIVTKLKNLLFEGEVKEYSPIKIPKKVPEETIIEPTHPKTDEDIPRPNDSENVSKYGDKHKNSDFDLNELKENIKKYHETHPEENSETIKGVYLEFSNYTENKNILIAMKLSYYTDKKCCASCFFCYISPVRTHRCLKHNFDNKLNGRCDDYTYNKIQIPDV